ncbi:MAG: Mur ligase domain-containing protein [Kiritimatiellae bacterium]|jgi:UDP-N-acetylmuramate--alanine ligase|nr:Mur ligase domain-containing protein [Kiritimatiellia bacterium]
MRERVHIVGIGGVGMSALAQALLDSGVEVSGSDRLLDKGDSTPVLNCLASQKVALFPQDGSGVDASISRVVISSAIESSNPELVRAAELKVPVEHRSMALARVVAGHQLVAVTGTCGKSSVTAMLGAILAGTGFDPLVVNGAAVTGWSANETRIGSVRSGGGIAVIEADESDKSLMAFKPDHAIITNASADHFDLHETLALFDSFRSRVSGCVIDGLTEDHLLEQVETKGWKSSFVYQGESYTVPLPGIHNVHNAGHAVRMALALGADSKQVAQALAGFKGIERRLQLTGYCNGVAVIDDYAHNPEKLKAAWMTLASVFNGGLCALWRPHGYGPLQKMMDDLVDMFAEVCSSEDTLLLLPVYDAGGTALREVSSQDLASKLVSKGVKVEIISDLKAAELRMRSLSVEKGALVCFGARDPGLPRLAADLAT